MYRHKEWVSIEILDKIQERKDKKTANNNSRTRTEKVKTQAEYTEANKEVKRSIGVKKKNHMEDLAMTAEKAAREGNMTQRRNCQENTLNQRDLSRTKKARVIELQEQRNRWVEYFEGLLNRRAPLNLPDIEAKPTDLPIDVTPPTIEEIRMAIRQIKSERAAGVDNILTEALKSDIKVTANMLHILFRKIREAEQVSTKWKEGYIIEMPKKGNLSKCENYRGITLLSVPGKVFNRVLLNRIKDSVDAQLRDQQAGFRKDRSCTDQIATLRIIFEQLFEWNSSLYINFIDYEKSFDSVNRKTSKELLRHYGVPEIFNIIPNSYDGFQCKVVHGGRLTDSFQVRTGVRQGCLLSLFHF
ncbi:unnamed protein product [Schistosoma curassoni]|uniref:Reverse transcriptase domain-containing protein n=1 Tax=Schistosoma curassoni TaxID=6186 RepID=A0A183JXS8_9TREM|nr:unnamed protein product [Schistosoma curassoni]